MNLAFCLYHYFPYGGLQRDFLRIAQTCRQRGHTINVFTMHWEGELEPAFHLHLVDVRSWQNHTRCREFINKTHHELRKNNYDSVIGFNKMAGLDLYYAADVCYQARMHQRGLMHRLLPRYRAYVALEKAVFARGTHTQILLISPTQQTEFMRYYQTEETRFHLLPPGIAKDRVASANANQIRKEMRAAYQIAADDFLLLQIGSGFITKGLNRSIKAIAALPDDIRKRIHFFVIGQDRKDAFCKLAKQYQIAERIQFLGGRDNIPDFLCAADLLLHPALHENTGTVLLEAIVAGLPVLTTETCGYAHYVTDAQAGLVLPSPFSQLLFNQTLQKMLLSSNQSQWRENGLQFAKHADIYDMPEKVADIIERVAR